MVLNPKEGSFWSAIGQGLSFPGEVWTSPHSLRNQQRPGDDGWFFGGMTSFFFTYSDYAIYCLCCWYMASGYYTIWEGLLRIPKISWLWLRHLTCSLVRSRIARSVCQMFRLSCAVWIFKRVNRYDLPHVLAVQRIANGKLYRGFWKTPGPAPQEISETWY